MGELLLSVQDLLTVVVVLMAVLAVGALIVDRRPGQELWTLEDQVENDAAAWLARSNLRMFQRERARAVQHYVSPEMPAWLREDAPTVVRIKRRPPTMANRKRTA